MTKDKAFKAALVLAENNDLSGALAQLHRDLGFSAPPGEAARWQEFYVDQHWQDAVPRFEDTFQRYVEEMEEKGYTRSSGSPA